MNRCLLLTDGLANVGITDRDELARHAGELRARGVSTSTFGVGNDFDEPLLQALADAGGGHFYYIADAPQIRDPITSEVGETLEVVARDVDLELTARDGIRVESISPYPGPGPRQPDGRLARRPRLGAGGRGRPAPDLPVRRGRSRDRRHRGADRSRRGLRARRAGETEPVRLTWSYADDRANDDQPRDAEVDRAVARQFAARARQEAVQRNRNGDYDGARRILDATARRIRGYAGHDRVMRELIDELGTEQVTFAAPMAEPRLKEAHFASANMLRSRDATGRSVKRS